MESAWHPRRRRDETGARRGSRPTASGRSRGPTAQARREARPGGRSSCARSCDPLAAPIGGGVEALARLSGEEAADNVDAHSVTDPARSENEVAIVRDVPHLIRVRVASDQHAPIALVLSRRLVYAEITPFGFDERGSQLG